MATATLEAPGRPPEPKPRRWLPLLGLMGVIVFVTLGGFLFSGGAATPVFAGDVEVGTPVEVAQGVTIQPARGWEVTDQVDDPPGVVLAGGSGRLLAGVPGGTGSPEELLNFYVSGYLEPQASQLSVGDAEPVSLPAGTAVLASYAGVFEGVAVPLEGEVIAIVAPLGVGVVLDGWAQQGSYELVRDQVLAMAESVAVP
jgi:hypothetical protein